MSDTDSPETRVLLRALEVMKISANGALAMAPVRGQGSSPTREATAATDEILNVLQATAEGARAITFLTGKPETENIIERRAVDSPGLHMPMVQIPQIEAERTPELGNGPFVICERVGAISLATWQTLNEERLQSLDSVLKVIAGKILSGLDWQAMGSVIQQDLAEFGLKFATFEHFPVTNDSAHWYRSRNASLSDLDRLHAMRSHLRFALGEHWYTDEMIRVVQRLMDLRGFQI